MDERELFTRVDGMVEKFKHEFIADTNGMGDRIESIIKSEMEKNRKMWERQDAELKELNGG